MSTVMLERKGEATLPKKKSGLKSKNKRIISVIFILFLIASICTIFQNLNSASINVSANFSSITEGKNPDGSPFDINEILSDEVLERASQKLGGKIDAKSIKKHLVVSDNTSAVDVFNLKQKVVNGNTNYSFHPNVYTLTYSIVSESIKNEGFFASLGAVFKQLIMPRRGKILESIAESYSECYFERYIAGNVAMQTDWSETDTLDYYIKATETKATAQKISRFILSKYNKKPEFVSVDGIGYGDLYTEIEQIIDIDINNYTSFVIQNGLTSDKDSLLRRFAFMEKLNNEINTRHMSAYEITKDVIGFYDANTTKVVFIPALDDERTFYMNRTKVGIDYLIEKASSEKIAADDALHTAEKYRYLTGSFLNAEPAPQEVFDAADTMYNELKAKINEFINKADMVINEGSQSGEYEKIEIGRAYSNSDIVSMAVCGGKMFIMLLLVAFVGISLIEFIAKINVKKRTESEE